MARSPTRKKRIVGKRNFVALRRKALGMTQIDLAAAAGVDQTTISLFENQAVWPSYENLTAIARALNCQTFEQLWVDPSTEDLNLLASNLGSEDRKAVAEMIKAFISSRAHN